MSLNANNNENNIPNIENFYKLVLSDGSLSRSRPRTFPYFTSLPYKVESPEDRSKHLRHILINLYISIKGGEISSGSVLHWTRELKGWLNLKFDLHILIRAALIKLYYELALTPGLDTSSAEKFLNMFIFLFNHQKDIKKIDFHLDHKLILKYLKYIGLPAYDHHITFGAINAPHNLVSVAILARNFFVPEAISDILDDIMPLMSSAKSTYSVGVLNILYVLLPVRPVPQTHPHLYPQKWLPTIFHAWKLNPRVYQCDYALMEIVGRLAEHSLGCSHIEFGRTGIFTPEQTQLLFTIVLRMMEIPIGKFSHGGSVYTSAFVNGGVFRDSKKYKATRAISKWIIYSLSGDNDTDKEGEVGMLSNLEKFINTVKTFFHPSNHGSWSKTLTLFVPTLVQFFIFRWNMEQNNEFEIPSNRRLTKNTLKRFVLAVREVLFMGMYSKSTTSVDDCQSALSEIAYVEPNLILPYALQEIYPSLTGQLESHRTSTSLRALIGFARSICRAPYYRIHITTLLSLVIPGIDANDLSKTIKSLMFIEHVAMSVPFEDLSSDIGSSLAMDWISNEVHLLEDNAAGKTVWEDSHKALTEEEEINILKSSTAAFSDFLVAFLGRIFTLLENLPDTTFTVAAAEANVVNMVPATFSAILPALSPTLYDLALTKVLNFISSHVIHSATEVVAHMCGSLACVNPKKALPKLIPLLIASIKDEINENGACSKRSAELLPRDRAFAWYAAILSLTVVHVGSSILDYADELTEIALFMRIHCKGYTNLIAANFVHHILITLNSIYPCDYKLYNEKTTTKCFGISDWGKKIDPQNLKIDWHVPNEKEIDFAFKLFSQHLSMSTTNLKNLFTEQPSTEILLENGNGNINSTVNRATTDKVWSDDVAQNLTFISQCISGCALLFDSKMASNLSPSGISKLEALKSTIKATNYKNKFTNNDNINSSSDLKSEGLNDLLNLENEDDNLAKFEEEATDYFIDSEVTKLRDYPCGYYFQNNRDHPMYKKFQEMREDIGILLHEVYSHISTFNQDDISCFKALFSCYSTWFTDVGYERSARILEVLTELYNLDVENYQINGSRKDFPRCLLIRRSLLYHNQRIKHNACPRAYTDLDIILLLDLVNGSVSNYAEIRKSSQFAMSNGMKVLMKSRLIVIPALINHMIKGLLTEDFNRAKGAMYSLKQKGTQLGIIKDSRFTRDFIKALVKAPYANKLSINNLSRELYIILISCLRFPVKDLSLPDSIETFAPTDEDNVSDRIEKSKDRWLKKWNSMDTSRKDMEAILIEESSKEFWNSASLNCSLLASSFVQVHLRSSSDIAELFIKGSINMHPSIRNLSQQGLMKLINCLYCRSVSHYDLNVVFNNEFQYSNVEKISIDPNDDNYTNVFLSKLLEKSPKRYLKSELWDIGWLVWPKELDYEKRSSEPIIFGLDSLDSSLAEAVKKLINIDWFEKHYDYLLQEPRTDSDIFRLTSVYFNVYIFKLFFSGFTSLSWEEISVFIKSSFKQKDDKNTHRALSETLAALVLSIDADVVDVNVKASSILDFCCSIFNDVYDNYIRVDNLVYWASFIHCVISLQDYRRICPIVEKILSFNIIPDSNAVFIQSAQLSFLRRMIALLGFHFQRTDANIQGLLPYINHPYKSIRDEVGVSISTLLRTQYHESYLTVEKLLVANNQACSLGITPYIEQKSIQGIVIGLYEKLTKWRIEREENSGRDRLLDYYNGSKTVLMLVNEWIDNMSGSSLVPIIPDYILPEMLYQLDAKEDAELVSRAFNCFVKIANIFYMQPFTGKLINALVRIAENGTSWHHRLRVTVLIQPFFFRHLYIIEKKEKDKLFNCIIKLLNDSQLEVREGAAETFTGMVHCLQKNEQSEIIQTTQSEFERILDKNRMPKRGFEENSRTATPSFETQEIITKRHGAVLGLGALISAFPYESPPPKWIPQVLAALVSMTGGDYGVVAKSVKKTLSTFKKTRQDTWHVDANVFTQKQLEDLEGVLWRSYFA